MVPTPEKRPNFLIIQCDDLGIDDLGLNNPLVHTPNLDALAAESVRFSDFTVNPVCAPSRATFLTGRHFLKTGVSHVHGGKDFLHLDERTLADHFRAAGYATGMWGKWHSGFTEGYHPWQRGFSEAWVSQLYRHHNAKGVFNGKDVETAQWADEVIADYAIDFLLRHRDTPFLAYLATMTPHGPLDAPEKWVRFYRERGCSEALAKLWGMVSALDEQVGRVLKSLDESGLREQTVVVFMSDNGPAIEQRALSDEDRRMRKVSGLRGWKGDLYERGVRSPLFIRWPAHIAPRDVTAPADLVDLTPTLMDMAGIPPVPEGPPMDGVSFLSQLRGSTTASPDAVIVNYAHRGWLTSGPVYSLDGLPGEYLPVSNEEKRRIKLEDQSISIRKGNLKWIINPDFEKGGPSGHGILLDLAKDPSESTNVADQYPEAVTELNARLREWWKQITVAPHSFAAPIFHLRPGSNRIPARAPARVRGEVFNTVAELKGWIGLGDAAIYRVFSPIPTKAKITLDWKGELPGGLQWTIAIPETGHEARTGSEGVVIVTLPAGELHLEMKMEKGTSGAVIPPLRAIIVETANNAPWNMPVGEIPLHPESDHYCDLLWNDATADRPGNFNLTFEDYTYPVYETTAATGEFPIRTKWESNLNGKMMPWNPEWKPPPGSDAQIIVLDPTTGREWNLWQVRFDGKTIHATNGNLVQKGEEAGDGSDPGDYRTKGNGFRPSRGVGIQYLAMLVRPQEVREGVIRHALSMPIKNPDGTFFVPPATKLENYQERGEPGIPEGMRFSLMVTDVEIDAWIAELPEALSAETRRAARTIAVALREFGWFITDASGGAHFQFEARMSAAKDWEELGLGPMGTIRWKDYPQDLLDGLITRERLRAHVPSDSYPR